MRWIAVIVPMVFACATDDSTARPGPAAAPAAATVLAAAPAPPAPVAPGDACASAALRIEITPPGATEPKGEFAFRWQGQGTGERSKFVCLRHGTQVELVPRGERRVVAIRASARELQRIVIDGRPHLIPVTAGESISLGDNPCFFYELSGARTEAWFVDPPSAYCAAPGKPCRRGFTRASRPGPFVDDLCGETEKEIRRCVAQAEVRVAPITTGSPPPPSVEHDVFAPIPIAAVAGGQPLSLDPRSCGFPILATGAETVALVVGAGERWALALDAGGRLSGTFLRPR